MRTFIWAVYFLAGLTLVMGGAAFGLYFTMTYSPLGFLVGLAVMGAGAAAMGRAESYC